MTDKLKSQIITHQIKGRKLFLSAELKEFGSIDKFLDTVAQSLSGGVDFVELSGEGVTDGIFLEAALKTKQLCELFGAVFGIKNRVDIAYLSSANCVNLEQESIDIHSARKIISDDFLIGFYINTTNEGGNLSVKDGADYVLIHPHISTPTEPVTSTGLEYAKWVSENNLLPVLILNNADKTFPPHSIGLTYSTIDTI